MHRTSLARGARARWMALLAAAMLLAAGPMAGAQQRKPDPGATQEGKTAPRTPEKKIRGRLPAYYSRVVSQEQRTEIYSIQARFNEQMAALRKQLETLAGQRDKEVRGVLTAEQQRQVDEMVAAAKARRGGKTAPPPPPAGDGS